MGTGGSLIAVVNAGSSSLKFALYEAAGLALVVRGQVEEIGSATRLAARDGNGATLVERALSPGAGHAEAIEAVLGLINEQAAGAPVAAVGHRVVHGGREFAGPVRIDPDTLAALRALEPLAPLHQPHNLAAIAAVTKIAPQVPQVACFDTAFHRSQSEQAEMFALPRRFHEAGVRRYGFHGLSYEWIVRRLRALSPELAAGKVVIAHLGAGSSLCGVEGGRSVTTTMGFSTVDGLVMGTRTGALDPGVLLYLMDSEGLGARELEDLIYRRSGLLGVSGISADMRTLRASEAPRAAEAIALFAWRIVREIGACAASLGGIDGLVFTGGIGENDARLRAEVAEGCGWLGLQLDAVANDRGPGRISAPASRLAAWVIPTDEERMMALHTARLLGLG